MRYIIDERIGCIAVVDTAHPDYPSGNGLHFDYPEVMAYWKKRDDGEKGASDENRRTLEYAERLCRKLNEARSNLRIEWKQTPAGLEGFLLGGRRVAVISDHGNYASGSVNAPDFRHKQTPSRVGGGIAGVIELKEWCESEWSRFIYAVKEGGGAASIERYDKARALPDGWVAVPVEPTEAMLDAAEMTAHEHLFGSFDNSDCNTDKQRAAKSNLDYYRAMLSSSPDQKESSDVE